MQDFTAVIASPRLLALYAHMTIKDLYAIWEMRFVDYDKHYQVLPEGQKREVPISDYVRITEPVEVTFTGIDDDTIVQKAVESLNEQERKIIDEMNQKLADIRERKNQLLSLTHETRT